MSNYPAYPVFSWRPVIVGTVGWDDGVGTGSIDLATDIGSTYWGAVIGASAAAGAASIQARLAALLVADIGSGSIAVTYTWPDGDQGPMVASYARTGTDVALTFSTAAVAAQFGFDSTTVTFLGIIAKAADFSDAGQWAPRVRGGSDERWEFNENVGVTETIDGSSAKVREWGATLTRRAFSFPTVYVANIRADAAANTSQAASAGRDIADPNNLLSELCARARSPENTDDAAAFRVYTDESAYRTCYMYDGLRDVESICENQSTQRIWRVTFAMRDRG